MYSKYGKIVINGKKKIVYRKVGSSKNCVKCKGRMMSLVRYKKMITKKAMKKQMKGKSRRGGEGVSQMDELINNMTASSMNSANSMNSINSMSGSELLKGGKKRKARKTRKTGGEEQSQKDMNNMFSAMMSKITAGALKKRKSKKTKKIKKTAK